MKKILVVESFHADFKIIRDSFNDDSIEILHAENQEKALSLFLHNKDVSVIVIDACVPGSPPNTVELIKIFLNTGYNGPIIACSNLRWFRDILGHTQYMVLI